MRGVWIAGVMLVACSSWAESPKDIGTSHHGPNKANSTAYKADASYPSKENPLPVLTFKSKEDIEGDAATESYTEKFDENYLDTQRRMAIASENQADSAKEQVGFARIVAGVAIFDIVIAALALIFLIKTFQETKRTADATIKTFVATHRPRLILREAHTALDNGHPIHITAEFANTGGTRAQIIDSRFAIILSTREGAKRQVILGGEKIGGEISDQIETGTLIEAGSHYRRVLASVDCNWPMHLPIVAERTRVINGSVEWHYSFFGKISYKDEIGVVRNMAFYRELDWESFRYVSYGDSQLEYSDERA